MGGSCTLKKPSQTVQAPDCVPVLGCSGHERCRDAPAVCLDVQRLAPSRGLALLARGR